MIHDFIRFMETIFSTPRIHQPELLSRHLRHLGFVCGWVSAALRKAATNCRGVPSLWQHQRGANDSDDLATWRGLGHWTLSALSGIFFAKFEEPKTRGVRATATTKSCIDPRSTKWPFLPASRCATSFLSYSVCINNCLTFLLIFSDIFWYVDIFWSIFALKPGVRLTSHVLPNSVGERDVSQILLCAEPWPWFLGPLGFWPESDSQCILMYFLWTAAESAMHLWEDHATNVAVSSIPAQPC